MTITRALISVSDKTGLLEFAGFLHKQHAGCDIPWLDRVVPACINAACGKVCEVERGCAEIANNGTAFFYRGESRERV